MKTILSYIIIACMSIISFNVLEAQVSMVYSLGISPQQAPEGHYVFVNRSSPDSEFTFNLSQVKASYFVGAGVRYAMAPFFLMTEAQYNKRSYVYDVVPTSSSFIRSEETIQFNESMHVINVPVSVGVELGFIEVFSGFLPQFIVSHQTDLDQLTGYSDDLKTLRFGWHTGIAAKVNKLRIGLTYQMDANNYADHISINDQPLKLTGRSNRLVGSLAFVF
ncbi:MAG TPA: hypothetical protein VLA46_12680 [Saprospiraceae bacterium]|nr:hypothetical protein [Saprospiraceae bacterium]